MGKLNADHIIAMTLYSWQKDLLGLSVSCQFNFIKMLLPYILKSSMPPNCKIDRCTQINFYLDYIKCVFID